METGPEMTEGQKQSKSNAVKKMFNAVERERRLHLKIATHKREILGMFKKNFIHTKLVT